MFALRIPLVVLLLVAASACADAAVAEPFRHTFVLASVEVDPTSSLGAAVSEAPAFSDLVDALDLLDCDGLVPLVFDLSGTRVGSSARGQMRLQFSQHVDYTQSCSGAGQFLLDPGSLDGGGQADSRGPVWIEGPTFEGRIDPGAALGEAIGLLFADWVTVSGVMHGDPPSIDFGRVSGLWTVDYLHGIFDEPTGITWLDGAVTLFGAQPDVDRDADGLERFLDTDGDQRIDTCIDGDGTRVEGMDCPTDSRFSDGFAFVLLFRVVRAEITGVAEISLLDGLPAMPQMRDLPPPTP